MRNRITSFFVVLVFFSCFPIDSLHAETINIQAQPINYKSRLFFSPRTYSVTTDSEFSASLYLDTLGFSVNTLNIQISFPANLVSVVRPSGGESLISMWVTPPTYSNTRGTMEFSGVILGGTKTDSGLIEKITFRAKSPGTGTILIRKTSRVLVNDGFGSETEVETIPLKIIIEPKAPEGFVVISNTHSYQGEWSNNKDPIFSWEKQREGESYSHLLDDKPFTVPDQEIEGTETQANYENIKDGIWYFHLRSKIGNLWSVPTHYAIRVDTTPPAKFNPTFDLLQSANNAPAIVSFFSTDALSGISHYEVGVLDAVSQPDTLPAFIQSESPFYLPKQNSGTLLVTVRAIDHAGNVRDESITVRVLPSFLSVSKDNISVIMFAISLLLLVFAISMFVLVRRRIHPHIRSPDIRELVGYQITENHPAVETHTDLIKTDLVNKLQDKVER